MHLEAIIDQLALDEIEIARPVITSCGSGVTAAILSLGLETIGAADVALYDGSWTEWGGRPESVVVSD